MGARRWDLLWARPSISSVLPPGNGGSQSYWVTEPGFEAGSLQAVLWGLYHMPLTAVNEAGMPECWALSLGPRPPSAWPSRWQQGPLQGTALALSVSTQPPLCPGARTVGTHAGSAQPRPIGMTG